MARHIKQLELPRSRPISTNEKLGQLYELIDGIKTAMMTTRARDGSLVSRPMATQARAPGTDLWFMTNVEDSKIDELIADPHVNLGYFRERTGEYVSVSGLAHITQDPLRIYALYNPSWKLWLNDNGDDRDGGPDDPRIALIEVTAESATYMRMDRPYPITLFSIVRSILKGQRPSLGNHGYLDRSELSKG